MTTASLPVDGSPEAAAVDPGSDDSGSDHDQLLQEPKFVFHAMDDRRPSALLPIPHRQPSALELAVAAYRKAARVERLCDFMLLPQAILCSWTLLLGSVMILCAKNPHEWGMLTILIVYSVLVMLFSLLTVALSFLGVYHYDKWLDLNE
ncbi:hypothetical protein ACP70R_014430 [Stipagrostis hirtigluma subsp. patula]